jgi:hypothetical protein
LALQAARSPTANWHLSLLAHTTGDVGFAGDELDRSAVVRLLLDA